MTTEVKAGLKVLKELRTNGKIATLVKARKGYKCDECGLPIEKGEQHYCIYIGGGGLGSLKFPDRIHIDCIDSHLNLRR